MKFKVGDVCIFRRCAAHAGREFRIVDGTELTLISVNPIDPNGLVYETDFLVANPSPGYSKNMWSWECCLELKRPPAQQREQLGEWELCPWRPHEVTA